MIKKHLEKTKYNKKIKMEIPDKIYLILENAIDSIFEEFGDDVFRNPSRYMIEREFRFMFREKGLEKKQLENSKGISNGT